MLFLIEHDHKHFLEFYTVKFSLCLSFMVDLFALLNGLNTNLQRKNNTIVQLYDGHMMTTYLHLKIDSNFL